MEIDQGFSQTRFLMGNRGKSEWYKTTVHRSCVTGRGDFPIFCAVLPKGSAGETNYKKRLRDGCESTLPVVHQDEREIETRLSLALLKAIPSSLKQPALEKGLQMRRYPLLH